MNKVDGIELVVFDKDGTLLDMHAAWGPAAGAWVRGAAHGDPAARDALATALGADLAGNRLIPDGIFAAGTFEHIEATTAETLMALGWDHSLVRAAVDRAGWETADALSGASVSPLGPVAETMAALVEAGIKIAVLTSDDRGPTAANLAMLGIDHFVSSMVCADDPFPHKPDPAGLLHLIEAAGTAPDRAVMVGDSAWDMHAGERAGVALKVAIGHSENAKQASDVALDTIEGLAALLGVAQP